MREGLNADRCSCVVVSVWRGIDLLMQNVFGRQEKRGGNISSFIKEKSLHPTLVDEAPRPGHRRFSSAARIQRGGLPGFKSGNLLLLGVPVLRFDQVLSGRFNISVKLPLGFCLLFAQRASIDTYKKDREPHGRLGGGPVLKK